VSWLCDRETKESVMQCRPCCMNAKISVFEGTKENFPVWGLRFQRFAKTYTFRQKLKETPEANLPRKEEDESNDTDAHNAARQRNDDAVYCLIGPREAGYQVEIQRNDSSLVQRQSTSHRQGFASKDSSP
jgi:hypothetical protein